LNANGSFSYTPALNYNGSDSFTYHICDNGQTGSPLASDVKCSGIVTVSLSISSVNDAPANLALTLSAASINENGSTSISGSFTDVESSDSHTVVIYWGDGSTNTTINLIPGDLTIPATSHTYLDDNPTATTSDSYTITVTVTDDDSTGTPPGSNKKSVSGTKSVTVSNVAPAIVTLTGPPAPLPLATPGGTSTTVGTTFTDVGSLDTHTCTFAWDDGTANTTVSASGTGNGSCSSTHTFTATGVYTVTVTVSDDDGGADTKLFQYVVIFDPNAGFVTGGGWIMSPAGACTLTPACETQTGKANFGFVSKYKKGSNTPEGQTEFQFQAGDINFHSSAYDVGSLVVQGYKAQYRGTGSINGVPGYKFVLTAYDGDINGGGGIDRFRMKITLGGTVVYDNRMGDTDDIDNIPMSLAGGSINIQKAK
jgi:hypothetical protein